MAEMKKEYKDKSHPNRTQAEDAKLLDIYGFVARSSRQLPEDKPRFGGSMRVFRDVTTILTEAEKVPHKVAETMASNAAVLFRSMKQVNDYLRRHRNRNSAQPLHDLLQPLAIPERWQDHRKTYQTAYDKDAHTRNEQLRPWTEAIIQQGPRMAAAFANAACDMPARNGHNYSIVESESGAPPHPRTGPGSYGKEKTREKPAQAATQSLPANQRPN